MFCCATQALGGAARLDASRLVRSALGLKTTMDFASLDRWVAAETAQLPTTLAAFVTLRFLIPKGSPLPEYVFRKILGPKPYKLELNADECAALLHAFKK